MESDDANAQAAAGVPPFMAAFSAAGDAAGTNGNELQAPSYLAAVAGEWGFMYGLHNQQAYG